jgi:Pre-toxin TG
MELYHSAQSIQSNTNRPVASAQDHVAAPTPPTPEVQQTSGFNYNAAKFLYEHQKTWYGRAGIKALDWMNSPEVQEEINELHQATEELTSFVTSGVPILGTAKGITEMYTGQDVFTGQPVSKLEAGVEIGFGLLPEAGLFKQGAVRLADKMFGRQVAESATPVADHLGSVATETKTGISNSSATLFGKVTTSAETLGEFGARGAASGRVFDETAAGIPVRDLAGTQSKIKITHHAVDVVESHVSRFGPDAANQHMIQRLRNIASGKMVATQVDRNFYSHELREFTRYRKLGWKTGVPTNNELKAALWNNTHTATLEDYRLSSKLSELYTPQAIRIMEGEQEVLYKNVMKLNN